MRHRAEVQLDKAVELPAIGFGDADTGVGGNRSLLAGIGGERLTRLGLTVEESEAGFLGQLVFSAT